MKDLLTALFLALLLSSSGCGMLWMNPPDNPTPAQIKAYNEAGIAVYSCLTVKGPPPNGTLTIITAPISGKLNVTFDRDCIVLGAPLRVQVVQ